MKKLYSECEIVDMPRNEDEIEIDLDNTRNLIIFAIVLIIIGMVVGVWVGALIYG